MGFAGEREQGTLCPALVIVHVEFEAPSPTPPSQQACRLEKEWSLL